MVFHIASACFVILFAVTQLCQGAIEPKVLLPFFGNYQVNYTITAEEGCYRWKSLREEVAIISPTESTYNDAEKCSKSATVVVTSTQPIRKTTLILATNIKTGTVFQCDVIVDRIHEIDVVSRTRELYLADPPEELKIRALDQEGNTFSSTAGMEFEWSLLQDDALRMGGDGEIHHPPVSAHSILHIQKFVDTIYVAENYVDILEKKGKLSDTILVSGIQTGAAVIVADLVSTVECHKSVKPSSVRFIVRDKVMLNPSYDVYLMKHAVIHYKVDRWREGVPTEIKMPSPQYILNVRDIIASEGTVISLDKETSMVVGLNVGHSQVYLVDQHLKHFDDSLEQATSDIFVAEPAYLRFEIEPYNRWILEVDRIYEITVHIYSKDNKRIWPSDNVRLIGTLNDKYLEVIDNVKNGTWYLVRTLAKGSCDISSLLKGVVSFGDKLVQAEAFSEGSEILEMLDEPILTSQNLEIFDRILVTPEIVLFPWQPEEVKYRYTYKALGGSGKYTWSVNETRASSISYTGEIMVSSGSEEEVGPRIVEVKATDIRNSYHFGIVSAILAPPVKLKFVLSHLETEVGTSVNLYIGMYAKIAENFIPFTDCSLMRNLRWSIHDSSTFEFSGMAESVPEGRDDFLSESCLSRQVHALKEGHTTVSLSYYHSLLDETMQDSTVIAAYNPLRVKDPVNLAVVSLGSSKLMIFQGGPNPWPLLPNNHEKVITGNNDKAEFKLEISGKEHTFHALCIKLGEVEVTFTVKNKPCTTNPFPRSAQIVVRLSCAVPTSLKLSTEYLPPSCPLFQNQNVQTVALAGDTMRVTLLAFEKFGNQFDNFTSLSHQWKINSASFVKPSFIKSDFIPDSFKQAKHFMVYDLVLPNDLGGKNLEVFGDRYEDFVDRVVCSPYKCKISPPVRTSILLNVVSAVTLMPQSIVMFNRPNYSTTIEISGGSGHFEHRVKTESSPDTRIISTVTSDSTDRTIYLTPLSAGHTTLTVSDLCVSKATEVASAKPRASVVVSDLSSLFLKVTSLLEVGTLGSASIQLDLKQLSAPDAFDINIQLSSEPAGVVSLEKAVKGRDLIFYANVKALRIGTATIKATTASRDDKVITSNIVKVSVFPPLMLKPPRITVIRASEFHLFVEGGPSEDVQINYDVADPLIASSSSSGVLTAHKLGNTTVKVRAVTADGQIFHGKSHCVVHVVQIKGVLIDVPTHRFYTGATVPVHIYGYAGPGFDPVNLDSDAAGLVFSWNVNNHAVLGIRSVHSSSGIRVSEKLKFTMLLDGKAQGQALVSVSVSATNLALRQLTEQKLKAEMQVAVFDPLFIQDVDDKIWSSRNNLLLTPETSYYLSSNRDGVASKIDYAVLCESCSLNVSTPNDDDCIIVNNELKSIFSGKSPCQTTIQVTAQEKFGATQTLAIHVRVKMVSFIITEVKEKFRCREPDVQLFGFPLGSKLSLEVRQFDNFGLRFDATKPNPDFVVNRNDLLEITPSPAANGFQVRAANTGVSIFRIWSEKNVAYNFPLPVVSTIEGEETNVEIPIGVKKCFESNLAGPKGEAGEWSVDKPYSVVLDSKNGVVLPKSRLSAELRFSLDPVRAKLSISFKAFSARFCQYLPDVITNVKSQFIIPIEISDTSHDTCHGLKSEMEKFAKATFNCTGFLVNTIEPVRIFDVSSTFVEEINSYACVLNRVDLVASMVEKISTFDDATFTVSLIVKSEVADRGISVQSPVNLRFLPAFKIINESHITMTTQKILLCVSATLEIHNSIEVTTDSRNFEIHSNGRYNDGIICHVLAYNVNDDFTSKHLVKVVSPLTDQVETVKLSIKFSRAFFPFLADIAEETCADPALSRQPWIVYPDSYTYWVIVIAFLVIIITTLLLFSSCGILRWIFSTPPSQQTAVLSPGPRRTPPGMVPYSPSNYLFSRSSPGQQGSPPVKTGSVSPRRQQLWSSFYQPQDAGIGS